MEREMDRISALCDDVRKMAKDARKVKVDDDSGRKKQSAVIGSFKRLASGSLEQLAKLKADLFEKGKLYEASKIPDAKEAEDLLGELESAVSEGDAKKIAAAATTITKTFSDLSQAAGKAKRAANAAKKEEAGKTQTRLVKQFSTYGRGVMSNLFGTQSFQHALGERLKRVTDIDRFDPAPIIQPYEDTSLAKPGSWEDGIKVREPDKSEEEEFEERYCGVQDLPLKVVAPLSLGNILDGTITDGDFREGRVLDTPYPPTPPDLDYTALLKHYAETQGEIRYFYVVGPEVLVTLSQSILNFHRQDQSNEAFKKKLFDLMSVNLLFRPLEQCEDESLMNGAMADLIAFRSDVLNWGRYYGGQWHPSFTTPSAYPPESLDNFLFEYRGLFNSANQVWEGKIAAQLTEINRGMNDKFAEMSDLVATPEDPLDKLIIDRTVSILRYFYYGEPQDTYEGGADHLYLPFKGPLGAVVKKEVDELDVQFVEQFLDDPAAFYGAEKMMIKNVVDAVTSAVNAVSQYDDQWYYSRHWAFYKAFQQFFESVKNCALDSINQNEDMSAEVARIKNILNNRVKLDVKRMISFQLLRDQLANGTMYYEWVGAVSSIFRRSCRRKRIVTDPYLPLVVLPNQSGPYGELPKQLYSLERLSYLREGNFHQPAPSVGLLKEYHLDFRHQGFGLGGHLYSQTLFPGETVSLDMRTYHKYKKTQTESTAENIFDEATSDTMEDFSRELKTQLQWERSASQTKDANVGGSIGANILDIVNIGVEGGGKWSSKMEERSFADKLENLLSKLSTKLSQKRQITFDVKREQTTDEEYESEIKTTKTYSNDNKEKNLTINFFQITREYETQLFLNDIKFFYSSGRFPLVKLFVPGDLSVDEELRRVVGVSLNLESMGMSFDELMNARVIESLPPELWDYFPPNAFVVIVGAPYNVKLSLSHTNAFLVSTFGFEKAKAINERIWQIIGSGQAAPDGLGVAAFPFGREENPGMWPEAGNTGEPWNHQAKVGDSLVCADRVRIEDDLIPRNLPTLDIRYKSSVKVPARYIDDPAGMYSVPKLLWSKSHIVNTNGVYAENMLGRCTALEDFAVDHRRLDVRLKELQVKKEGILLGKTQSEVNKVKALTPPVREAFKTDKDYQRAFENYRATRNAETLNQYGITASPNANVNVNVNLDDEAANLNVAVVEPTPPQDTETP